MQKPASSVESYRNFFDCGRPGELPYSLHEAVQLTADIFEQLVRQFGFQYSSMRNQQEHLAMLLANAASHAHGEHGGDVATAGLDALHKQLLSNYVSWTRQLGVTSQCAGESDVMRNKATDLVLYVLIWGEAANLKHVPESLCFLFHKMRLELWRTTPASAPQRPQQWFLQYVINPLYKKMRTEMNRKSPAGKPLGHTKKANYDDFNEFFWSSDCLRYSYHDPDADEPISLGKMHGGLLNDSFAGQLQGPPVSSMTPIKKYVERRHWLHPIRSFWRIHAFLLLVLHVMIIFAFCSTRTGLIADAQLVQALCGVILTHAALGIIRECLLVYAQHGMLHTHLRVLASLLLRLSLKVGFAATLSSSYMRMVEETPFATLRGVDPSQWITGHLYKQQTFCYASALYLVPVSLSTLAQIFPILSTWVRSWRGPLKAIVDLFEPTNAIFVGKAIHTSFSAKMPFDFFWVSLLALKFWFSYSFQIAPLVQPTRELWALDLSDWYPDAELGKLPNMVVLIVRWAPLVIMYMIDLQLWFMLWTAMYGTIKGCQLHIGEVPDLPTVRERFLAAAENFNQRMLSRAVGLEAYKEKPYPVPRFSEKQSDDAMNGDGFADVLRAGIPQSNMAALQASLMDGADGADESGDAALRNDSLRYFADAWNGILEDMRNSDLLSNHEQRLLVFRSWSGPLIPGAPSVGDLSMGGGHFSRCTYLPVFCTAGKVNEAFHLVRTLWVEAQGASTRRRLQIETQMHKSISADFEMREALTEFFELTVWLLAGLLGPKHATSLAGLLSSVYSFVSTGQVLRVLGGSGVEPPALPQLSAAVVGLAKAALKVKPGADISAADIGGIRGKLTETLDKLKACLKVSNAPKEVAKQLETIGFELSLFWDDAYARDSLAELLLSEGAQWTEKLTGIVTLCTTAMIDTMPEEFEVKRRLCWFVGSLFMDIPRPPPVANMHSWTVMTPFYAEDLLYSAKELAAKTEDGVSTLIFLKTVHGNEWNNFLERVGVGKSREDEMKLFKDKRLLEELRLWASFRGQTLARTVEGMMLHEKALKLLGSWEGLRDHELHHTCTPKVLVPRLGAGLRQPQALARPEGGGHRVPPPALPLAARRVRRQGDRARRGQRQGRQPPQDDASLLLGPHQGRAGGRRRGRQRGDLPRAAARRHHARGGQAREPEPRGHLHARRGAADDRHEPVRLLRGGAQDAQPAVRVPRAPRQASAADDPGLP